LFSVSNYLYRSSEISTFGGMSIEKEGFSCQHEIGMIPAVKLKFNKKFHLPEQKQLAE